MHGGRGSEKVSARSKSQKGRSDEMEKPRRIVPVGHGRRNRISSDCRQTAGQTTRYSSGHRQVYVQWVVALPS